MRSSFFLLPAVLLAACGDRPSRADDIGAPLPVPIVESPTSPSQAYALTQDLVVSTNEPFWQARVEGDILVVTGVDTAERRLPVSSSTTTAEGRAVSGRDAAGSVEMIVRGLPCQDDMSGARFPFSGTLSFDGGAPIRGCARPVSMAPPGEPGTGSSR